MKRYLVLGPQEVIPPTDGGREGIHGAIRALARDAQVTYAYPTSQIRKEISANYLDIGVISVPIAFEPKENAVLILKSLFCLKPYKFKKYSTRESLLKFKVALQLLNFDAIICCHPHMFDVAEFLKNSIGWTCPIILREHNIEYGLVKGYAHSLSGIKKMAAMILADITRREEIRIWDKADGVAFLTTTDFEMATAELKSGSFFVAPEGTPIPTRSVNTICERNNNLLILLNKKATQSVFNVVSFLETVWAERNSRGGFPDVSITITGVTLDELSDASSFSKQELCDLRVSCVGFVESLDELFDSSLALVSPTYVGGGIRKKILESMANYLPVIASSLDVDSTDYFQDQVNILKFDDVDDLKNAIALLSDSEFSNNISNAARTAVEEHASWERFAETITKYLSGTIGKIT
tara:strand:- start:8007 stop:9236 length:1230 start_codon:yes stop_codon:yes gene_type:complete